MKPLTHGKLPDPLASEDKESEPHDHTGLLSGRGVDHVHADGSLHKSIKSIK
jgi:hypothetical protein